MRNANASMVTVAVLLAAIIAVPVMALQPGEEFGQWTTKCVSNGDGADACHIFQKVVVEGEGDSEKAVQMSVGFAPGESTPVTVLRMPLGLWLTHGVVLTVDGGESQQFPVQICAPAGCQTTLQLEADMLETLKQGSRLDVTTFNARQEAVRVPISLEGFAAAVSALQSD